MHEIIEFPLVLVDAVNLAVVDEFHAYIRPTERPSLTHFCKSLTGITQQTVDAAVTLEVALEQFDQWLAERQLGAPGERSAFYTIALATDGPWDIVNFLAPECERKGVRLATCYLLLSNKSTWYQLALICKLLPQLRFPLCATHWINARQSFAEWHMCRELNVQKSELTHRRCHFFNAIFDGKAAVFQCASDRFPSKMMDFVLQMMDFALQMMDFALKMMNFGREHAALRSLHLEE